MFRVLGGGVQRLCGVVGAGGVAERRIGDGVDLDGGADEGGDAGRVERRVLQEGGVDGNRVALQGGPIVGGVDIPQDNLAGGGVAGEPERRRVDPGAGFQAGRGGRVGPVGGGGDDDVVTAAGRGDRLVGGLVPRQHRARAADAGADGPAAGGGAGVVAWHQPPACRRCRPVRGVARRDRDVRVEQHVGARDPAVAVDQPRNRGGVGPVWTIGLARHVRLFRCLRRVGWSGRLRRFGLVRRLGRRRCGGCRCGGCRCRPIGGGRARGLIMGGTRWCCGRCCCGRWC